VARPCGMTRALALGLAVGMMVLGGVRGDDNQPGIARIPLQVSRWITHSVCVRAARRQGHDSVR
jgi:hypothetical protein